MQIRFGLCLQEQVYPERVEGVDLTVGESGFLQWAEQQLGIRHEERQAHLRTEQYRQVLAAYLSYTPKAFFADSFSADAWHTTEVLLSMRDELLLAGWKFAALAADAPQRLQTLAQVERIAEQGQVAVLDKGFAERFLAVEDTLRLRALPLDVLHINEPLELLPVHWRRLMAALEAANVRVVPIDLPPIAAVGEEATDLQRFQAAVFASSGKPQRQPLRADGSLMVLRAASDSDAAFFIAKLARYNSDWQPVCLVAGEKNTTLDVSLVQEGLPSLGIPSPSYARPTPQLLKLVSQFLFEPIDPYKLLEFLSLPSKPMHEVLARSLADALAEKPGLFNSRWNATVAQFRLRMEEQADEAQAQGNAKRAAELRTEVKQAMQQYDFWFRRRRYDRVRAAVPARTVVELYDFVSRWAFAQIEQLKERAKRMDERAEWLEAQQEVNAQAVFRARAQAQQARQAQPPHAHLATLSSQISQIVSTLPASNASLNALELERIIRTLEQPLPVAIRPKEVGHWQYATHSSALLENCEQLLWWNFVATEGGSIFSRWYQNEVQQLAALGVHIDPAALSHRRQLWQQQRAVQAVQQRLMLVIPDFVSGKSQKMHPLWSDLRSLWGDEIERISYWLRPFSYAQHEENSPQAQWLAQFFQMPERSALAPRQEREEGSYLHIQHPAVGKFQREEESYSSLEKLFYTPQDWVLQHQLDLRASPILNISSEERLKGNLAHSIINKLFEENLKGAIVQWEPQFVASWFDREANKLVQEEGAPLMMQGKESQRADFLRRLLRATQTLVAAIYENGWTIVGTEQELRGEFAEQSIRGFADLVLQRGEEYCVVDIKWASSSRYKELLQNYEDLQLVLYSRLLAQMKGGDWAHTAYFSLQDAQFVARSREAFRQAQVPDTAKDAAKMPFQAINQVIWDRMQATFLWRKRQIDAGIIALSNSAEAGEELPEELLQTNFRELLEVDKPNKDKYSIYKPLLRK